MNQNPPPEQTPQTREFRRGHKHSASLPANMQAYANRPLPPLPVPPSSAPRAMTPQPAARSSATSSGSLPAFAYQGSFPINRRNTTRGDVPTSAPRRFPSLTMSPSPARASQTHRNSYAASTWSRRSSQQKVFQLTGMDVDVMDDQSFRSGGGADSDSSSTGSGVRLEEPANYDTPDYHLVPVLETDVDESSSRGSSWGPMSPDLAVVPQPLHIHKQPIRDGSEKHFGTMSGSFMQMHLEDGVARPWDPAFGQFGDHGAAGEYHQFTAQLASRHSRQLSDSALQPATPPKKKRSSLSLAFSAATRFRRRESTQPIDIAATITRPQSALKETRPQPQQQEDSKSQSPSPNIDFIPKLKRRSRSVPATPILALASAPPPRPSPAPPLMSAWDSDSDDEDGHVMSSLKDWFANRTSEDGKIHRRTSSASRIGPDRQPASIKQDPMRESIIRPQDRYKQVQMEKAAKRREQMRPQMKVVPEGIMLHNVHL